MVVDGQLVLDMIVDEQLVIHMIVVMEEVNRIVVVEELLKTVDVALMSQASRIFSSCVRSANVLSLIEASVFGVGGTLTVPN
ncbi:hypothetical protein Tco_0557942 [Tanacetum coccineum]